MIYRNGAPVEILAAREIGEGLEVRVRPGGFWVRATLLAADAGPGEILAASHRVFTASCRLCACKAASGRALCDPCAEGLTGALLLDLGAALILEGEAVYRIDVSTGALSSFAAGGVRLPAGRHPEPDPVLRVGVVVDGLLPGRLQPQLKRRWAASGQVEAPAPGCTPDVRSTVRARAPASR